MSLPIFQTTDKDIQLLQTNWAQQINPVIQNPINNGLFLKSIDLISTSPNVINHLLGRNQQGWFITDINGSANIYRSAAFNNKTLTLTSSANVTVNIYVF